MTIILMQAISYFAQFIQILIFIRIILSWIPIGRDSAFVRLVYTITEPLLAPIRNLVAKSPLGGPGMMLDFSPLILMLLVHFVSNYLIMLLR